MGTGFAQGASAEGQRSTSANRMPRGRLLRREPLFLPPLPGMLLLGLLASRSLAQAVVTWGAFTNVSPEVGSLSTIAAGTAHFVGTTAGGDVVAWGVDQCGQTRLPVGLGGVMAVAAGELHSLALRTDGRITSWGCEDRWGLSQVPEGADLYVDLASGPRHCLALRADRSVVAWGENSEGQCDVPPDLQGVSLAAGGTFSLVLKPTGTVAAWGNNGWGQCRPPADLVDVTALAAGATHALALRADGTIVAWGDNRGGQCDVPASLRDVSVIRAGPNYSLALKADGTLVGWGAGAPSQPPAELRGVIGIAAGGDSAAALLGGERPVVVRRPSDRDAVLDTRVVLSAAVHGLAPLSYQWWKDGQALSDGDGLTGATTPLLVIARARLADSGRYALSATNAAGDITTPAARLWVFGEPRVDVAPESQVRPLHSNARLTVAVLGAEPLSYHWLKDGVPVEDNERVSGATTPALNLGSLLPEDAATYRVAVSNAFGSVTSEAAVLTVGQAEAQGENWCGELDLPPGLENVVMLAAGDLHALALRRDGTVVAWGDNLHGQCDVPDGLKDIQAIAAGGAHSLALRRDGTVTTWGYDKQGLLSVPPDLDDVIVIAAGTSHSLALRADGTVVLWGVRDSLDSEVAAGLREVVAIAAGGGQSLALKANGTVFSWGQPANPETPADLRDVVAIAAGRFHSLALKADGTVAGWGPKHALAAQVPEGLSNVVQIAAGAHFSLALKRDGSVMGWGFNRAGEANPRPDLTNVVAMAGGGQYRVLLRGDGHPFLVRPVLSRKAVLGGSLVFGAEVNGNPPLEFQWRKDGQLLVEGNGISGVRSPVLSLRGIREEHEGTYELSVSNSLGLVRTGPVWMSVNQVLGWGEDAFGQAEVPGGTREVVSVAAGDSHTLALHADGSVSAWGEGGDGQTEPPAGRFVGISAGRFHNLALRQDGTVVAWGRNNSGQCDVPSGLTNVVRVAAGGAFSLALRTDGTVIAWGQTVPPPGLEDVADLAAGSFHAVALRRDGTVVVWGSNRVGQGAVPGGLSEVTRVAAGAYHTVALRTDGTVVAWGLDRSGQGTVPADLTEVVDIVAGGYHSLALKADGSIVAWGLDQAGQCSLPGDVGRTRALAAGRGHSLAVIGEGTPGLLRPVRVEGLDDGAVRLSVSPVGDLPMELRWFRDGQPLEDGAGVGGVTTTNLTLQADAALSGQYQVRLVNASGEGWSLPTDLSAALGPRIRIEPAGIEVLQGTRVRLAAEVEGAGPIVVQWLWNGEPLGEDAGVSGVNTTALEFEAIVPSQAGSYELVARNPHGFAVSRTVDLMVSNVRGWGRADHGESLLPSTLVGIRAISLLADHTLVLRWDGTVAAFGDNAWKQCDVPPGLTGVVSISAGETHSMALRLDGEVTVWGGPSRGQHLLPPEIVNIRAIAADARGCYALDSSGRLFWWAAGSRTTVTSVPELWSAAAMSPGVIRSMLAGQQARYTSLRTLGPTLDIAPGPSYNHTLSSDGRVQSWSAGSPVRPPTALTLLDVFAIAGGVDGSCIALTSRGRAVTWQAGAPTNLVEAGLGVRAVSVAAGRGQFAALTQREELLAWGNTLLPPRGLAGVTALAGGGSHVLALGSDGRVQAWGDNAAAQCVVPAGLSQAVAVAAGDTDPSGGAHSLALRRDGHVVAWGDNSRQQTNVPKTLAGVVAIAAGRAHSLALDSEGSVVAWGDNSVGACSVPLELGPVVAIAAGASHSVALTSAGKVVCWGANVSLQAQVPEGLDDVIAVSAGSAHSVALRRDGSVVAWGRFQAGTAAVATWSNIVAIAGGGDNIVGLRGDGTVLVAGDTSSGQDDVPTELRNVDVINAGDGYVLAAVGRGPLARALDEEGLQWRTSPEHPWLAQWRVSTDGGMAAQSALLAPAEESWVETEVHGPGVLQFWWRTASAESADALEVLVNGALRARREGRADWELRRLGVPSGEAVVRWRYIRSAQSSGGDALGWLDRVSFEPLLPPGLSVRLVDDSHLVVEFDGIAGLTYVLQRSTTLGDPGTEWVSLDPVLGTGQRVAFVRSLGDGEHEFYRVVIE